jgi:predicted ATPase/tRNA A-37 threonylcarbamoyl transferase component Bud32
MKTMMFPLDNYTTTAEIHQGAEAALYRGHRNTDHAPVTIKLLRGDHPDARAVAKLRHEHALLKDLAIPGVVKPYGLEKHRGSLALILEDLGGEPLHAMLKARRLDLKTALSIAASLAETLDALHRRQIVHKDIKPQNILVNEKTGAVTLIDFGIATRLPREPQRPESPPMLEGTLAYVSPEQTGRMNRVVDSRTDLYSLGVTLYEMLTGVLPFQSRDPMELVHSHIARRPVPPHEVSPTIPRIVSDITMKLLSKAAEDRYQSASGLATDLEECLAQLTATGDVAPFPLLRRDRAERLQLPQKLYGRDEQCLAIASAWDRAALGAAELLLVSGYSGVGKSVLVHEIHKSIARGRGHFIAGKFNQLDRSIPYAPIAHALRDLIGHLLTEPAEGLARWKNRIGAAVGANGQILVDLIPELGLILGPQPRAPELGPTESQHRFALVFQSFLRALSSREHPLAIFLDDLQWADPASLKLVELLLTDPERSNLLVLGAYRDNEVDAAHPLMLSVDALRKAGAVVSEILLSPLSLPDVTQLVADAVAESKAEVAPLAALVFEKTQGNPFFVGQFLDTLEQEKMLAWDAQLYRWVWDARRIAEQLMTDNVVDFMAAKIERLPEDTRHVLKLCAAMGHRFDLNALSLIDEISPAKAAAGLWDALREGLLLPLRPEYRFIDDPADPEVFASSEARSVPCKFMHDRVRQAAYSLIAEGEKQKLHLRIGRLLLASSHGDPQDEALFDIANHLSKSTSLITDHDERTAFARLSLAAGKKAKAAAAAASAAGYLKVGLSLLEEDSWETDYDLTLALYMNRAECAYMSGAFDEVESSFEVLLAHVKSRLDRARVHQLRIVVSTALGQFERALEIGRTALAPYGIDLPESEEASFAVADAELRELDARLAGRTLAELLDAPLMTDPDKQVASNLLAKLVSAAFFTGPSLYSFLIGKQVNLSLEHGYAEASPSAYGSYSVILYAWLGRYKESYDFGKLSMDLCERLNAFEQKCQVIFMFAHVVAFYRPLRSSLPYLEEAIRAGLESGDLPYVSYSAWLHLDHRLGQGDDLAAVTEEADRYLALMQRTKNPVTSAILRVTRQMSESLRGRTRSRYTLSDDTFDAESFKELVEQPGFILVAAWFYAAQMELLAIHEDYDNALAMARLSEEKGKNAKGFHTETDRRFFTCLVYCALYPTKPPAEQEQYAAELADHYSKLASWAEAYPESFLHKKLLVDAERARIQGDEIRAMNLYGEAIELARQNEFFHHEAIGSELAAKFHLGKGRRRRPSSRNTPICSLARPRRPSRLKRRRHRPPVGRRRRSTSRR